MKIRGAELAGLGFVVLSFVAAAVLYDRLPERMATHWNSRGVADGFMPKALGAVVMPTATAFVHATFLAIPRISPRGYGIERFRVAFDVIHLTLVGFLFVVSVLMLLMGAGVSIPIVPAVYVMLGVLLIVLGNFMGKLTKNFFVGIRTPWTLANDEVWLRTHRLGGRLFVVAGLAIAASAFLGSGGRVPVLAGILVCAAIPIVYSYLLYRKLER